MPEKYEAMKVVEAPTRVLDYFPFQTTLDYFPLDYFPFPLWRIE